MNEIIQILCLVLALSGMFLLGYIVKGMHKDKEADKYKKEQDRYYQLMNDINCNPTADGLSYEDLRNLNNRIEKGINNYNKKKNEQYIRGSRRKPDIPINWWRI